EGMAVYEAELPAEPVTGELSEEIELLYIDLAGQPHDSYALERYIAEHHPDLLIVGNMDGWFTAECKPEKDFAPFYACIGKWRESILCCTDRFAIQGDGSPVYNVYNDHAVLYDLVTGRSFTIADAASEEAEPEPPVLRIDLRSGDCLEGKDAAIFACEDVTEEVSRYLGQENMSARLYGLIIEE
ncbi:MAG: hypothetical protein II333_04265, partial [Clostridia bacterium]|nr:hypothetical protein [Clostridia bacterium]